MKIVDVPEQFRVIRKKVITGLVTEQNSEEAFYRFIGRLSHESLASSPARDYLPVFWSDYYFRHGHAHDKAQLGELQRFLDGLPRDRKYFTVSYWDDGLMNDLHDLDVLHFSAGGRGNVTIPLLEYSITPRLANTPKTIPLLFRGHRTHPVRDLILGMTRLKEAGGVITDDTVPVDTFMQELAAARFALAPRGYGKASYRMYEAFAVGAVPIYVYDDEGPALPYEPMRPSLDWASIAVSIHQSDLAALPDLLKTLDADAMRLEARKACYEFLTSFSAVSKWIWDFVQSREGT